MLQGVCAAASTEHSADEAGKRKRISRPDSIMPILEESFRHPDSNWIHLQTVDCTTPS